MHWRVVLIVLRLDVCCCAIFWLSHSFDLIYTLGWLPLPNPNLNPAISFGCVRRDMGRTSMSQHWWTWPTWREEGKSEREKKEAKLLHSMNIKCRKSALSLGAKTNLFSQVVRIDKMDFSLFSHFSLHSLILWSGCALFGHLIARFFRALHNWYYRLHTNVELSTFLNEQITK